MYCVVFKNFVMPDALTHNRFGFAGQKRSDLRCGICFNCWNCPFGNDMTAIRARFGTHFDDPIGFLQNLRVVIDQNHGVAVSNKIVHHACKSHNVGRVKTNGRLVQYIEDSRRTVAHGSGKLHSLPLTRGKRGCRTVKCQIAEPQIHEPLRRTLKRLTDTCRHWAHFLRQAL